MTNVKSLLEMYVKMGGSLTDTYSDIAGGVPVGQYSTISDAILACSKKYSAGGGGGAEKFVVTLTQENDTWTANKTIAEIVAADAENQIVVAKYPDAGVYVDLPLNFAVDTQGASGAVFIGLKSSGNDNDIVSVTCLNQGGEDAIQVTKTQIPTSTNAPLIVTLTADASTGDLVGNKTYKEVYDAFNGGQAVTLKGNTGSITFATNALSVGFANDGYSVALVFGGSIVEAEGAENDYVTLAMD